MSLLSIPKIQLFYVYDPMCSWCWGYRPTWLALQKTLQTQQPEVEICYRLGGLACDSNEAMPIDMQQFLKKTWQKIADQLGTQFNFTFWELCQPRRSTYPACRACLIARGSGLEEQMYFAIQQAYYLHAQNPSDNDTLIKLAKQIGLDETAFSQQLSSMSLQQQLLNEITETHALPIQGFPSLVLSINGHCQPIPLDYLQWQHSFDAISRAIE